MGTARLDRSTTETILTEGAFFALDGYALRQELIEKVNSAFLQGIEKLAGKHCREQVERDGLRQLHRHFPVEKVLLLEAHLMNALQKYLYYWSYRVGADTLGLPHPFYVDHLIVFRIHYPFLVARKAAAIERPPVLWRERLRLAAAALGDWKLIGNYFAKRVQMARARRQGTIVHDPTAYFGQIPVPARSHGAHIDTWYGHSYDGINLWLSIDGVNEDNTVILYPEMFGRPVKFDPESMYMAKGVELSRPYKVPLKPWELLVFNPEMLHGTQVNISEETRVALTTRINPRQPRFTADAPFHMEHWYCSEDLQRGKSSVRLFPAAKYQGRPSVQLREPYNANRTVRIRRNEKFGFDEPQAICATGELRPGDKMVVDFADFSLILWRGDAGGEVRAYSSRCPHLGIDLADGFHDDKQLFCPGHGIGFSLADGRSSCQAFKLRKFRAFDKDGTVYVARTQAEPAAVA